ncbi:MAG: MarR family transcriptional regulator [Pseudomonadota bacterium]
MKSVQNGVPLSDAVLINLRRIIQSIDLHSRDLMKRFGLTIPQLMILNEIERAHDISASDLARAVSLSQATVTGILERLENRGLITRKRSESDRRRIHVRATDPGRALLDAAPPLMQESFTHQFSMLASWEQHMILAAVERIAVMMNARRIDAAPVLATGPIDPPAGGHC